MDGVFGGMEKLFRNNNLFTIECVGKLIDEGIKNMKSYMFNPHQTAIRELVKIPALTNIVATFAGDDAVKEMLPHVFSSNLLENMRDTCI